MPKFIRPLIAAAALFMTACAPVDLLNTITPSGSFERMEDIGFSDNQDLKLDVYKPDTPKPGAPIILFVYGGGWNSGDKSDYKFIGESFTSEGYTVVIPNYRLHPGIAFPDPITDIAKAAAWAAKRFEGRSLILIGHSAGAYNVLMTSLDGAFLEREGVNVCEAVAGVVSLAGPTGIIPLKEEPYITIFPDRFTRTDAPMGLPDAPSPPLFLVNGLKDKTVYPQNAQKLGEKTRARSGEADVKIYDDLDHTDVVRVLSRFFDGDSALKGDILTFIARHSEPRESYCQ